MCAWTLSHIQLFEVPWTVVHQTPLSTGILQERILGWVAVPSSRRSSQTRDQTQVSRTAGRFFIVWATREAQEYWSGQPIRPPGEVPDPGIKTGSPALQMDSLPAELPGKNHFILYFISKQIVIRVSILFHESILVLVPYWLKYCSFANTSW